MLTEKIKFDYNAALNVRVAANFVKEASNFKSEIWLEKAHKKVNGKSIMGIMSLASINGNEINVVVDGEDEASAIASLANILKNSVE